MQQNPRYSWRGVRRRKGGVQTRGEAWGGGAAGSAPLGHRDIARDRDPCLVPSDLNVSPQLACETKMQRGRDQGRETVKMQQAVRDGSFRTKTKINSQHEIGGAPVLLSTLKRSTRNFSNVEISIILSSTCVGAQP